MLDAGAYDVPSFSKKLCEQIGKIFRDVDRHGSERYAILRAFNKLGGFEITKL